MKETVQCQVVYMERPGVTRKAVVPVEESAIRAKCWREIACIKAAVYLEVPFSTLTERAKYGFRPEDKARLFGKLAADGGDSAPAGDAGDSIQRSGRPTETREEETK